MPIKKEDLTVIILAGGKSQRMGGSDKGLLKINGKYIIKHLHNLAEEYTSNIYINANRNIKKYQEMGLNVWSDLLEDYQGPLAGIYTSLLKAETKYILTYPCDGPFISKLYFDAMLSGEDDFDIKSAHDGTRIQPVHALLKKNMVTNLQKYLNSGQRKIDKWYNKSNLKLVNFSEHKDLFININNKEELSKYEGSINEMMKK